MAASHNARLDSEAVSRYEQRYAFGRHLLLISKIFLVISFLPLVFVAIQCLATLFSFRSLGMLAEVLMSGIIFVFYAGIFWILSLVIKLLAYRLFSNLDIAVNGESSLTDEEKSNLKNHGK